MVSIFFSFFKVMMNSLEFYDTNKMSKTIDGRGDLKAHVSGFVWGNADNIRIRPSVRNVKLIWVVGGDAV